MATNDSTKCYNFRQKIWCFCFGIIIGYIGNAFWENALFSLNKIQHNIFHNQDLEILQSETNEKLLKYIEGKWRSSIGDLIVNVDDTNINGSFVVIENLFSKPTRQEKFKVVSIKKVDGLFGIVELTLCSVNTKCEEKDLIPIQINKVFGINKTITMTYNSNFSYCLTETDCTRAFKEVE